MSVKSVGRIIYIEPNNLPISGVTIGNGDNITWNPEDLCVDVDLQIVRPNRIDYGIDNLSQIPFNILLKDRNISIFKGADINGDGYLTTEYTKASYNEIKGTNNSNNECLYIKSVDIKFDSDFYPYVTIKFVDIRGYSLMMPTEYKEDVDKSFNNFYQSFFHYPYPTFFLRVKGLYGDRVTFVLSVTDFNSKLDSSTGNIEITANFIGQMYGIYTDIPFNFLIVSPYLYGGNGINKYWSENITTKFMFKENIPMCTYIEYIKQYNNIIEHEEDIINDKTIKENANNIREKGLIENIISKYDNVINNISNKCKYTPDENNIDGYIFFKTNIIGEVSGINGYYEFLQDFISYKNEYNLSIPYPDNREEDFKSLIFVAVFDGNGNISKEGQKFIDSLSSDFKKYIIDNKKNFINCSVYCFKTNKVKEILENRITELTAQINAQEEKLHKAVEMNVSKYLGFKPSIENITRMLFAHLDCFMHFYYDVLDTISSNTTKRIGTVMGLDSNNSDLGNLFESTNIVPPYPAVFDITGIRKLIFPSLNPKLVDMPEVKFVNEIALASLHTSLNYQNIMREHFLNENKGVFTPINITDFIQEGMNNPYSFLTQEQIDSDCTEILCYYVLCRVLSAMFTSINAYSDNNDMNDNIAINICKIEADNFYNKFTTIRKELYYSLLSITDGKTFFDKAKIFSDNNVSAIYKVEEDGNNVIIKKNSKKTFPMKFSNPTDKNVLKYNNDKGYEGYINIYDIAPFNNDTIIENNNIWENKLLINDEDVYYGYPDIRDENYKIALPIDIKSKRNVNYSGYNLIIGKGDFEKNLKTLNKSKDEDNINRAVILTLNESLKYPKEWGTSKSNAYPQDDLKEDITNGSKIIRYSTLRLLYDSINIDSTGLKNEEKNIFKIFYESQKEKLKEIYKIITNENNFKDGYLNNNRYIQNFLIDYILETKDIVVLRKEVDECKINKDSLYTFINELITKYNKDFNESVENSYNEVESTDISVDIKLAIYLSLKGLFDKWLCSTNGKQFTLNTLEKTSEIRKKRFTEGNIQNLNNLTEFDNFIFVDNYYNDISDEFIVNPQIIYDLINKQIKENANISTYSFLSQIMAMNNIRLIATPIFNNFYTEEGIIGAFKPKQRLMTNNPNIGTGSTYICMYTHEYSHHTNGEYSTLPNYANDGFDIADTLGDITPIASSLFKADNKNNNVKYMVPAFGVTYGKQNQSYFTNISVNIDTPRTTDSSLNNTLMLSKGTSNGDVKAPFATAQDMFNIYSNRSYNCDVQMMGCANITPMMYFQLNNIPMFKGAYLINKVVHHIENNTMTTIFSGVRVSKNHLPYNKSIFNLANIMRKLGLEMGKGINNEFTNYQGINDYNNIPPQTIPEGKQKENARIIMNFLMKNCNIGGIPFNKIMAAAAVGNFMVESNGCNPGAIEFPNNPQSGGMGICQWTGQRRRDGVDYLNKRFNKNYSEIIEFNLNEQLALLKYELDGAYYNRALKNTNFSEMSDIAEATKIFELKFEGASDPHMERRIGYAKSLINLF